MKRTLITLILGIGLGFGIAYWTIPSEIEVKEAQQDLSSSSEAKSVELSHVKTVDTLRIAPPEQWAQCNAWVEAYQQSGNLLSRRLLQSESSATTDANSLTSWFVTRGDILACLQSPDANPISGIRIYLAMQEYAHSNPTPTTLRNHTLILCGTQTMTDAAGSFEGNVKLPNDRAIEYVLPCPPHCNRNGLASFGNDGLVKADTSTTK